MHQTSHVQVSKTSTVSTDSTTKINLCHCVRGCVFLQYAASLPPAPRQSRHAVLLTWRQQVRPRSGTLSLQECNGFRNRFIPFSIQNKAMIPGPPPFGSTVVSTHTRPYILHGWSGRFVPQRIARSMWGGPKSVLHPIPCGVTFTSGIPAGRSLLSLLNFSSYDSSPLVP